MSSAPTIDITPRTRRLLQAAADLRRHAFTGCRVADLGCAHGTLAIELARRGATALGIEGRQYWIDVANRNRDYYSAPQAEFVRDDVKNFSVSRYGQFDIVICAGLLYHLDSPDLFDLVERISEACTGFAIFDTHVALHPKRQVSWRGHTYSGMSYREHFPAATERQREEALGASLDDEWSFWLTKPSLLNLLQRVGFTSVLEIENPVGHVYENGEIRFHPDTVSLVAIKGERIGAFAAATPDYVDRIEDWPEDVGKHLFLRPHTASQAADRPDERAEPGAAPSWWSRLKGTFGG